MRIIQIRSEWSLLRSFNWAIPCLRSVKTDNTLINFEKLFSIHEHGFKLGITPFLLFSSWFNNFIIILIFVSKFFFNYKHRLILNSKISIDWFYLFSKRLSLSPRALSLIFPWFSYILRNKTFIYSWRIHLLRYRLSMYRIIVKFLNNIYNLCLT